MFDHHKKRAFLLFAAADVILTILAFEAAYQTRAFLPLPRVFFITTPIKALLLGFVLVTWFMLGRSIGAYARLYGSNTRAAIFDSVRQVVFGALGLIVFIYFLRMDISRPFIALFVTYDFVLLSVYRAAAGRLRGWVRKQFGAEFFCVVVGEGREAKEMARSIEDAEEFGVKLLTYVDLSETEGDSIDLRKRYPVKRLDELEKLLRDDVVDEVFFVVDASKLSGLEEIFLLCDEEGVRTRVATHFFPHVNSRISLDRFGNLPLLTFSTTPHDEVRLLVKRVLDVTLAALSLAALAIPMLTVAAAIKMTSPGPVIFSQTRCGLNGRRFLFYKFRSMVKNAEELKRDLMHLNEKDGPAFKIAADPRLTPIGSFLRRYSIDEWPQFWNILRGDMSFVGPRPAVPQEVEQYETWQRRRMRMRPGLTCLWAIRGRDTLDFEDWMRMDLEYIDNWSLWLDLKIVLYSIPMVLAGKGAN